MGKIRAMLALSGVVGGLLVSGCGVSHQPTCQTDRQLRGYHDGNTHCTTSTNSGGGGGGFIPIGTP